MNYSLHLKSSEKIFRQVAGASFRGLLLICLLNLTHTIKSASHTSRFALKDKSS